MTDVPVNLKVKGDARDVEKVGRAITKAFDPKAVTALTKAQADVLKQITAITKEQTRLNKEMAGVEKGSKEYRRLAAEVKAARTEGQAASRTFKQLSSVIGDVGRQTRGGAGGGGGAGGQQRGSFWAGMAQGAGLGEYIPSGPGMGRRMAGRMIGGGLRAGAAPFMNPGAGGISTMLQAIPGVGGAMAGALQSGLGMYGQAAAFDKARMGNLYFANQSLGQKRGRYVNPAYRIAEESVRSAVAARERTLDEQGRLQTEANQLAIAQSGPEGRDRMVQKAAVRNRFRNANYLNKMGVRGGLGATGSVAAQVKSAPDVAQIAKRAIKQEIQKNKQDIKSANDLVNERSKGLRKISKYKSGGVQSGLGAIDLGAKFGIGPMEAEALKGEMFGASGGLFQSDKFKEALGAKVRFGIGAGQSGQFLRAGGAGGGGTGTGGGLAGTIRAAFVQGLEGSQIQEYLGTLVNLTQQAERQGVKINVKEFNRQTATLTAAGMQGLQGQRIAGQLQQGAMNVSARGVSGPMDILMARAAGWNPKGGAESYAGAMNKLGGGMDSEMMNKLLGGVSSGLSGFGPQMQALLFRRALGKVGVQVGPGQATSLLKAYQTGGKVSGAGSMIRDQEGLADGMTPGEWLERKAKRDVRRVAPTAVGQAYIEAGQIGVGRGMAGLAQNISKLGITTAGTMRNFSGELNSLTTYVTKAVKGFRDLSKDGFLGLFKNILIGKLPGPTKSE